jgi:hypothetical protein
MNARDAKLNAMDKCLASDAGTSRWSACTPRIVAAAASRIQSMDDLLGRFYAQN